MALGLPVIMLLFTQFVRVPGWYKTVKWVKINNIAYIASTLLALASVFMTYQANVHYITAIMLTSSIAILSYILFQSWTDIKVRKADRGTLRLAFWLMLPVSLLYYIYHLDYIGTYELGGFLVALLVGSLLLYMPGFGASDGRAIQLAIVAGFPAIGVVGVGTAMLLYTAVGLIFIIFIVAKYGLRSLSFINKLSIPAVPFLLFPFVMLTLYAIADLAYDLNWFFVW